MTRCGSGKKATLQLGNVQAAIDFVIFSVTIQQIYHDATTHKSNISWQN